MTNQLVNVSQSSSGILHISLSRPDQLNALNHDLLMRLSSLFTDAASDASIKAILLTGEGRGFCAGADIKQLQQLDGVTGLQFAHIGQSVFRQLELSGKPSLAAIHGFAFGGGCELAMSATLRIAVDNAVFGQPEIKLGVIPGFGGTQRLARLIGKGRALDICLTGRRFSASEALQWGFLNEVTSQDKLIARANEILEGLITLAPFAQKAIMSSIHQGYDLPLNEGLEVEAMQFGLCCTTADKKEGVSAFLEKRAAAFTGA